LILLGGCGWILGLHQGLLVDTAGLMRRDGFAAFEGPGAGAASRQQRQRERDREEGGETLDGGRELNRRTSRPPYQHPSSVTVLRRVDCGGWTNLEH
jgi:hypothetical protein